MNNNRLKIIDGWIEKAYNHIQSARENSKSYYKYSETIELSQECIELSVKSILLIFDINFPKKHGWEQNTKEFNNIVDQIQKKQLKGKLEEANLNYLIPLPRFIFLLNFWAKFYSIAKYGYSNGFFSSARDLFKKEEAELALNHAEECYSAASRLRNLDDEEKAILFGISTKNIL